MSQRPEMRGIEIPLISHGSNLQTIQNYDLESL